MVKKPARSSNDYLGMRILKPLYLHVNARAPVHRDRSDSEMSPELLKFGRNLHCQLPGWSEHKSLYPLPVMLNVLKHGDGVSKGLTASSVCLAYEIATLKNGGYGLCLDGKELIEAHLLNPLQQPRVQVESLELPNSRQKTLQNTLEPSNKMLPECDCYSGGGGTAPRLTAQ